MTQEQTINESTILEFLYAISRVIAQTSDLKPSLDEIFHLIHPILQFDYMLIHQAEDNDQNRIIFAKSTRFDEKFEGQLEWEELLANLVYTTQKTILQQPNKGDDFSCDTPHFLGIPIVCENNLIGSLVFIKIGIIGFSTQEVNIAEYISQQIALLLQRKNLQYEHEILEKQRRQAIIQETFISNITHELRNPLGCIKGYATTLLRSDIKWDDSIQAQFLHIIDQETDRLSELIDNLLDSARLQSGQMDMQIQLLRLDALVKDVVERTRLQNAQLTINLDMKTPLAPIMGDSRRLTQVIDNLLDNAIKHAPGSDILIKIDQNEDGITLSIKDHGPGIPEKFLEKIFDRFFRVPDRSPNIYGSGLGLFISKQIVQAHHGNLSVKSKLGHGANFIVYLPIKT